MSNGTPKAEIRVFSAFLAVPWPETAAHVQDAQSPTTMAVQAWSEMLSQQVALGKRQEDARTY